MFNHEVFQKRIHALAHSDMKTKIKIFSPGNETKNCIIHPSSTTQEMQDLNFVANA